MKDTEEAEKHAREAGVLLSTAEGEAERLRSDVAMLHEQKNHLAEMVTDIEAIISAKDVEFQLLLEKIKEASQKCALIFSSGNNFQCNLLYL